MKKLITSTLAIIILIPTIVSAGWWTDLFGKKTLNNTTSQKNVNTNTTTTTIGDTKNTILGDTNTIQVPDEQKSYILNFKDLDTIFGEKLSDANKTASQGVLYLGKSNEIINKASNDNVKQSKENTDVISKNLLEIKEIQGGILKLGADFPGIQTTVNIPTATQTFLNTLNSNIVAPIQSLGDKIQLMTNQLITNNQALVNAITNMPFPSGGGSGTSDATTKSITQTAHGFSVGNWVYLAGTVYTLTDSDVSTSINSVGVVTTVTDADTFIITTEGYASGLSGLTAGTSYYISGTPGAITATIGTKHVLIANSTTSGYVQQYLGSSQALTYGRINASSDLANTTFIGTSPGTKIPFNATVYSSGMTFSGTDGIIPSVTGRYRVTWLGMAGSGEFNNDGYFHVVQNGVSVASIFIDMMQAAGVNQTTPTIDVNLTAGQAVSLHYQSVSGGGDQIVWVGGSYFDISQLPTAVAPVVNTVAEYGEFYPTTGVTPTAVQTSSATAADFMSFTLPTAGTWEVQYLVLAGSAVSGTAGAISAALYTNADVLLANSEVQSARQSSIANAVTAGTATGVYRITTTGATTYKVKVWNFVGTTAVQAVANNEGRSSVKYKKISGFLPSSGQTVDYVEVQKTVSTGIAHLAAITFESVSGGNIPYNVSTGQFSLTAGKTYQLTSNVTTNVTNTNFNASWYNVTAGTYLGASGFSFTGDNSISLSANDSTAVITPSVNTIVELRNITGLTRTIAGAVNTGSGQNISSARITQLGSSAVIAGVYPGTTTNYTPVVTSTTGTAPTLPTSATISGYYSVEGKMMTLNFKYFAATTTGGADGTQSYAYSMPAGYTIDLTKAAVPSVLTNTSGSGLDGGTIGTGFGRNSTNASGVSAVPLSSTTFGFYFDPQTRLVGASALAATGAANTSIWATLRIPIN